MGSYTVYVCDECNKEQGTELSRITGRYEDGENTKIMTWHVCNICFNNVISRFNKEPPR